MHLHQLYYYTMINLIYIQLDNTTTSVILLFDDKSNDNCLFNFL